MDKYEFGLATAEDTQTLGRLISQSFNVPARDWQVYFSQAGLANFRVVRQANQAVGSLRIYFMGQWFGGQSVPMAGIAGVCIAPEHRGTGAATKLLRQTLQDLHRQGIPISVLYASTQYLYRTVGYEPAGHYCRFLVPAKTLRPGDRTLPMHAVDPESWEVFQSLYSQQAVRMNGKLDRHPAIWEQVVKSTQTDVYSYLIGAASEPEGYLIFNQQAATENYDLVVRDLVALTPIAGQRLWTFFADHRSVTNNILWHGPLVEPLLSLLEEQTYKIDHLERWLLRVIDVPKALTLRGYPPGITAELHLEIEDPLIPENQGRFILQVAEGQGQVAQGGRGELQLTIRGLAPLYTGLLTPHQLQASGSINGTTEAIAIASLLFSGSDPWMPDHF